MPAVRTDELKVPDFRQQSDDLLALGTREDARRLGYDPVKSEVDAVFLADRHYPGVEFLGSLPAAEFLDAIFSGARSPCTHCRPSLPGPIWTTCLASAGTSVVGEVECSLVDEEFLEMEGHLANPKKDE